MSDRKGMILIQVEEEEDTLPNYILDPEKDYALLMFGKPRMREDIYDLAKAVVSAGNKLVVNINYSEIEVVVHSNEDISNLCEVLSLIEERGE